jgi:hypothetical protein
MRYIEWLFVNIIFWLSVENWVETNCMYQYWNSVKWKLCGSGVKVNNCNNSIKLFMVCLLEILALCVLTLTTVDTTYRHVSGIYCCYLQGGSEWCVLWSIYVGTLIASETHLICRLWRWRLYFPPKCWCLSTELQGVTVYKPRSLKTRMNEKARNLGKYFKAVPQITLHTLHCNLIMDLPKPKHVATLLKQSNFSNYSVLMSHCLYSLTSQYIVQSASAAAICHAMPSLSQITPDVSKSGSHITF